MFQRELILATNWGEQMQKHLQSAAGAPRIDEVLFKDDLADMYTLDNGRPSLPPSLLCGVLSLQFHDGVGDEEAPCQCCASG